MKSCGLPGEMVALSDILRRPGRLDVEPGRRVQVTPLLVQIGSHRGVPRSRRVDLGQGRQTGGSAVRLADRDRTVQAYDASVGEEEQLVVPLDDLHPVGLLG